MKQKSVRTRLLPETAKVRVGILADPMVNYPSYQNNVPLVRSQRP